MKKILSFLLILVFMFLIPEAFQRCWFAYCNRSMEPFLYGFTKDPTIVTIKRAEGILFREPFILSKKSEGKNILFIGGSSVYGVCNDEFHAFAFLLENKVKGISCLNAGSIGATSDSFFPILEACCEEYVVPDIVVFYAGYNDIFKPKIYCRILNITRRFLQYSFLARTINEKIRYWDRQKKKDYSVRMKYIKRFEENMERSIQFAQSKHITVVLIPEILANKAFKVHGRLCDFGWYSELYQEIPGVLKNLAQKNNCYFFDPKEELLVDWENNFFDTVHLTDEGNEALSGFLAYHLPFNE